MAKKTTDEIQNCGSCRFCTTIRHGLECHRTAPAPVLLGPLVHLLGARALTSEVRRVAWPVVSAEDGCGEWRPREGGSR